MTLLFSRYMGVLGVLIMSFFFDVAYAQEFNFNKGNRDGTLQLRDRNGNLIERSANQRGSLNEASTPPVIFLESGSYEWGVAYRTATHALVHEKKLDVWKVYTVAELDTQFTYTTESLVKATSTVNQSNNSIGYTLFGAVNDHNEYLACQLSGNDQDFGAWEDVWYLDYNGCNAWRSGERVIYNHDARLAIDLSFTALGVTEKVTYGFSRQYNTSYPWTINYVQPFNPTLTYVYHVASVDGLDWAFGLVHAQAGSDPGMASQRREPNVFYFHDDERSVQSFTATEEIADFTYSSDMYVTTSGNIVFKSGTHVYHFDKSTGTFDGNTNASLTGDFVSALTISSYSPTTP